MGFKSIAFLALWTLLIGPVVSAPGPHGTSLNANPAAKIRK